MTLTIRKANIFDHSGILSMLVEWLEETSINGFPDICNYTGIWLADLIAKHMVFIATLGNKIVGSIALKFGFMPWNNEEGLLFNEFLMTDKKYRKYGVADKLIHASKDFADKSGLLLMMGHFSGTSPELKDKYLSIRGFKYAGANFIYKGA